jgi:transcriptional regulator with XRE-family HTH domain
MEQQQTLGDRIRFARLVKRWTQQNLAKSVQCSRMTIANWESGKTTPSRYGKAKLAHVLGVTVEELEGGAK